MDNISDEARALVNPTWRARMWAALKEVQRDSTARPEQLVNLAEVIHILTNKPSIWDDPQNEINDWAINHLIQYSFLIEAGLGNYAWANTVNLAAAGKVTADVIRAALKKACIGDERQAVLALAMMLEFYSLV